MMFDYIGALFASILFPMVFVPRLGLVKTSLIFGLLNACVGLWAASILKTEITRGLTGLRIRGALIAAFLLVCLICSNKLTAWAEDGAYADEILYARTTPYQRIIMTRGRAGFPAFFEWAPAVQFRGRIPLPRSAGASRDDAAGAARRVLVMGGGDGLALREILKYSSVENITLVDLDPEMTKLSDHFPPLAELNQHSLNDPRVTVVNQDAMVWLESEMPPFDVAIIDFPGPPIPSRSGSFTRRAFTEC